MKLSTFSMSVILKPCSASESSKKLLKIPTGPVSWSFWSVGLGWALETILLKIL